MRYLSDVQVNESDNLGTISSVGLLLGVVHVLAGADHLSAISLITLNKNMKESFIAGTTWGLGHCVGLSIIAAIFFGINEQYSFLENDMSEADKAVGGLMISLGCYGFYNARKTYLSLENDKSENYDNIHEKAQENDDHVINLDNNIIADNVEYVSNNDIQHYAHDHVHTHEIKTVINVHSHPHIHYYVNKLKSTKCYSIIVGTIHGVSGTGAVLGILPAVTLNDSKKTSVYLISFFSSSVLSMGAYAVAWSRVNTYIKDTSKIKLYNFYSQVVMSSITFSVGILWLAVAFTVGLDYYGL